MIQAMMDINTRINHFIWGVPAIICIMGVGFYLTYITGFIQFKKLGYTMKETIGKAFQKQEAMKGTLSPFQAVCTALAATVGTGNIAGVAGAIAIGGAGAVFWMWISALFGMCTKMAEVTLAVIYREENASGEIVGGPMYYIQNGLGKKFKWLAVIYAGFGILATFGIGVTTQVSTVYGNWVSIFTAIAIVCFAFSTVIAWGLYGARFIAFLFPNKVEKIFFIVYSCMALAGATLDLKFIWEISDTFNGLMSIPNLIALFLLAKVFAREVREYFSKRNLKEIEDLYL